MSTVDERADGSLTVHAKGAPEEVLARSTTIGGPDDHRPLTDADREQVLAILERYAAPGAARPRGRAAAATRTAPGRRSDARTPSASSACSASSRCSTRPGPRSPKPSPAAGQPGIRIVVVTGDYGPTAAEIARRVGIARDGATVVTGAQLER